MEKSNSTVGQMFQPVAPGVSWTAPPKSRPWLNPPKDTDVVSIANTYIGLLSSAEVANDLLDALETKTPLSLIAETFLLAGVSSGKHTIDAAVLVMPVVIEVLKTVAMMNDIETVTFPEELEKGMKVHPRVLKQVIKDMTERADNITEDEPMLDVPAEMGLMSRKKKEGV
jgi:hypothetical protein